MAALPLPCLLLLGVLPPRVCPSPPALTEPECQCSHGRRLPLVLGGPPHTCAHRWRVCVHVCGSGRSHGSHWGSEVPSSFHLSELPQEPVPSLSPGPASAQLPSPGAHSLTSRPPLGSSGSLERECGWQQALSTPVKGCVVDVWPSHREATERQGRQDRTCSALGRGRGEVRGSVGGKVDRSQGEHSHTLSSVRGATPIQGRSKRSGPASSLSPWSRPRLLCWTGHFPGQ